MVMKLGRMKKLKICEIDKSDLIVSVVSQLISFFEQEYQFDDDGKYLDPNSSIEENKENNKE